MLGYLILAVILYRVLRAYSRFNAGRKGREADAKVLALNATTHTQTDAHA